MEIIAHTDDAKKLIDIIWLSIDEDKLKTWANKVDKEGFTLYFHSTKSTQWENNLYIKPFFNDANNQVVFTLTEEDGKSVAFDSSFGYLLGRFVEVLIVHFSKLFQKIEIK